MGSMGSIDTARVINNIAMAGAMKRGDQSIEKYSEQYTDAKGFVKSRDGYRKKATTASAEQLKGTAPMTDQEYKNSTGRSRSTLLGG